MKRISRTAARSGMLLGLLLGILKSGWADSTDYDLYSWKNPNASQWCFSLVPASKEVLGAAAAKSAKESICGRHDAKRLMGSLMSEGSRLYWKTNEPEGLTLPPAEVVNEMNRFAETMDFKLVIPKGKGVKSDAW